MFSRITSDTSNSAYRVSRYFDDRRVGIKQNECGSNRRSILPIDSYDRLNRANVVATDNRQPSDKNDQHCRSTNMFDFVD